MNIEKKVRNCIESSRLSPEEFAAKTPWWRLSHIKSWGRVCEKWFIEQDWSKEVNYQFKLMKTERAFITIEAASEVEAREMMDALLLNSSIEDYDWGATEVLWSDITKEQENINGK